MHKNIFLGLFLLSFKLSAAEVSPAVITYIAPWEPHIDIRTSAAFNNSQTCGAATFYRIDLQNDPGAQAKLSVILAAFMAGKPVGLSILGCVGDAPKISGIRLYK